MHRFLIPVLAATALMAPQRLALAQCAKPAVPQNGFPLNQSIDNLVTYSDGYKAKGDLYWPTGTAPSCGWPIVVWELPSFPTGDYTTRADAAPPCKWLAAQGFAVWTFDPRGLGDTRTLNSTGTGFDGFGANMKFDFAEQIAYVRQHWNGTVSQTKLAFGGQNEIIAHLYCYAAAAVSGKTITVPGRGTIACPKLDAILSVYGPEPMGWFLVDGTLFNPNFIATFAPYQYFPVVWESGWQTACQNAFLNQDPAGLKAAWAAEPLRLSAPDLKNTTVPIFEWHGDPNNPTSRSLQAVDFLASVPSTTPVRMQIRRLGPDTTTFDNEGQIRWLDRFLWNIPNGVDQEARFITDSAKLSTAEYGQSTAFRVRRYDSAFPPADVSYSRQFLTDAGTLSTTPPSGSYTPAVVTNQVAGGYDPLGWLGDPSTATVLGKIPLSEKIFVLPATTQDMELGERTKVSLSVVPDATRFVLGVLLIGRAPGETQDLMLASYGRGIVNATPNQPMTVNIDLAVSGARLPAGTVLKLVVRNHWLTEYPASRELVTVPYFVTANTKIRLGGGVEASYVDLPFRKSIRAGLCALTPEIVLANPNTEFINLSIEGGKARAGQTYVTVASLSGQAPGILIGGLGTVPLNYDPFTAACLGLLNTSMLESFYGTLDPVGYGFSALWLPKLYPLPPALRGQRITFATIIWPGSNFAAGAITNPVDVWLR